MDILLCKSRVIIHLNMFSNYIMLYISLEVIQQKNTVQPTFFIFGPDIAVMTAEEKY